MPRPRLLVSLPRRPSSDASSLLPRKPPLRLTWNHCRRHMHRPRAGRRWQRPQKHATSLTVSQYHARRARLGHFVPSALTRVRTLLDMHITCLGLIRSCIVCFFISLLSLDSPLLIASFLLFAIGHQLLPLLSTLRPLSHLRYPIHSRSFDHHSTFRIRRRAACRHQDFNFAPFVLFFPTRSFCRVAYTVSRYLGLVIYIYPSPALSNARQLGPSFPLSHSLVYWATVAHFSTLSHDFLIAQLATPLSPLKNTRPRQRG